MIMGANIGTTITSQLVAFNLSEVAPVFLMAGVIMENNYHQYRSKYIEQEMNQRACSLWVSAECPAVCLPFMILL